MNPRRAVLTGVIVFAMAVFTVPAIQPRSSAASIAIPAPTVDEPASAGLETAVLAGGCFWGVQGVFAHVKGVSAAESGYAGGDRATANYETVSTGSTRHAESVRITYNPTQVTFGQLLQVFFSVVQDPTELNRQGPDVGTQYRSAIFAQDATQQRVAQSSHRPTGPGCRFPEPYRHDRRAPQGTVFPRRGVPPELLQLKSVESLHRGERHSQAGRSQAVVPGAIPRLIDREARPPRRGNTQICGGAAEARTLDQRITG